MNVIEATGYREALPKALKLILRTGKNISPRGNETIEVEDVLIQLSNPRDRVPLLPHRRANIFALLAETLWVFAGRDDLEFIGFYLSRVADFSDDGIRLEGAYGPRLRNWYGHDQLMNLVGLLRNDPSSRRAVISLFDPTKDWDNTRKDIPCNNWLQFTIRDERLNMRVTSRSMDVIWGSTLNIFEWTTMQELLAYWLSVDVGTYVHFIGSLHLYDRFRDRATMILSHMPKTPPNPVNIDLELETFDIQVDLALSMEHQMRRLMLPSFDALQSEWIRYVLKMLWSYCLHKNGLYHDAWNVLLQLPDSDLKLAGQDFYLHRSQYREFLNDST